MLGCALYALMEGLLLDSWYRVIYLYYICDVDRYVSEVYLMDSVS